MVEARRDHLDVLRAVVCFYSVNVVDDLATLKRPTELLFSNESMFVDVSPDEWPQDLRVREFPA
jgi:hypothetical protein